MPHKRAKASIRKARKNEADLPVAKEDATSADTPKGFSRLLRSKEMETKRQNEKKETKLNNNNEPESRRDVGIQPGERLRNFLQRVESEFQQDVLSAQKASKPVSDTNKRNQETRKQKKQAEIQKELDLYDGRDFDDLRDNVKFGETADAPAILNKIPKARGHEKQMLEAGKNKQSATTKPSITPTTTAAEKKDTGYESEEDENMKALKASHKRSFKNMRVAARIQLDNERVKVIEAYRAKKAKKIAGSGF